MAKSPLQAPSRRSVRDSVIPASSRSANRTLNTRSCRTDVSAANSLHGPRHKRSTKVAYVFQKAKNKPAVRVRKTHSKRTHKTMSAPGRRIPSLLRSAEFTVMVVSEVIESHIDYLLIEPPTWSPNVGHKHSPNNADLYAWAPPTALDIQQLFGAVELQIEELITFVPLSYKWAGFWHRCAKGGWEPADVAKLIVASRRLPDEDKASMDRRVKSLKGALGKSQKIAIGCPATSTSAAVPARPHLVDINVNNGGIDFTAYNWRYPGDLGNHTFGSLEEDCLLLRLAHKVTRMRPRRVGLCKR
ncbi:hypothetical protein SNOG_13429 [Parastagonospora nodorum SN15]|uniref:Uncharacterized protein n=1 Tax=Phaeosphaeria nodorum (strain SN15 / ATCC MYA-4574 / FGSC 10173) TaxID=321614 RepID=Q0U485_PHANO|nr:hypothetical protein SNOG_13429 [Parastagonospora nodorum SN15]EAT79313.1 hypothetical protein SNOG_13429 [Parastagonospora nodorum SN15]